MISDMFHILYPCINFSHVDSLYNTWMKVYTFYHVRGVVCIFLNCHVSVSALFSVFVVLSFIGVSHVHVCAT